ncbi:MAG: corrinoid protein [Acidobacteria bacterium]|nr:corrinoid protein [Acidobacteriota bacterium]MBU4331346.1 corrinoid protein [Acidobacteriota bacterium]MBU4496209.1 corrinoid protein [Acidobacteriota bacterium]MCG2814374.1 corrinoid protein [Candidatus Aminicenantes bacterium]
MNAIVREIAVCVERGKVDAKSPHPPDLKGREGADELTVKALHFGQSPQIILTEGLIAGMGVVGEKFRRNEIYLPDVLMSARAMTAAMNHIRPYFLSGDVQHKGKIVLGTVQGDLHDIGKKIVGMFFEGGGWNVIDLGVDAGMEKYLAAIDEHNPEAVGLSALLTTTMVNMEKITRAVKKKYPNVKVLIGGAPITEEYKNKIGADAYSPDPQGALEFLNSTLV